MKHAKPARWIPLLLICIFLQEYHGLAQEENLKVFHQWVKWNFPGSMLIHDLTARANVFYEKRDREIGNLETKDDWLKRQAWVKDKLRERVGPFPEKTPLNPRTTGVMQRDGYRVEKVIYESMPDFYVTGCLRHIHPSCDPDRFTHILPVHCHETLLQDRAELVNMETAFPRRVYEFKQAAPHLRILPSDEIPGPWLDWVMQ